MARDLQGLSVTVILYLENACTACEFDEQSCDEQTLDLKNNRSQSSCLLIRSNCL